MRKRVVASALALVVAVSTLYAHELFIKFDTYFLEPDSEVRVLILNGTFALSENSVTVDRVVDMALLGPDGVSPLEPEAWNATTDTTYVTLHTGSPGTYVLGISTASRLIELDAESFNEYLEHDGIPDILEARRATGKLGEDAVERYSKHVKAVYQVGGTRTSGWSRALGYAAEIVPLENPYRLGAGQEFAVRCLVRGEPVANQLVVVGGELDGNAIEERESRTDDEGVVRFTVDRAGKWYIKFIHMAESEEEGVDYESNWATLTFEVR
ncbi:MAG: DUF4198 domain-containing protein [Gemmatimonadetes bacterium]|nr:DUF4198 domain-containing protein [Gemmatimonadota bacterium]NIO32577.1 DUF4198 domain-containing protein [Gemmatimonadota bacterium]